MIELSKGFHKEETLVLVCPACGSTDITRKEEWKVLKAPETQAEISLYKFRIDDNTYAVYDNIFVISDCITPVISRIEYTNAWATSELSNGQILMRLEIYKCECGKEVPSDSENWHRRDVLEVPAGAIMKAIR